MRKFICFLFFFGILAAPAQEVTMRDVFSQMPDTIVPYLDKNNRLDFVDFIDSHMDAVVNNSLGGKSTMDTLTADYLSLKLNDASSLQMKLLPVKTPVDSAQQIVCLVRTYGKDYRESTVDFYSIKWRKLPNKDYLICNDQVFEATLDAEAPMLTLSTTNKLDMPATEEQKETFQSLTILKWEYAFLKKD